MQSYGYPQQTYQHPVPGPLSAPVTDPWKTAHPAPSQPRHNSAPFPMANPGPSTASDNIEDQQPTTAGAGEDLEDEFWSPCYFDKHPDEIEHHLSLGMIESFPAQRVYCALPSTFARAEIQDIAPSPVDLTDGESPSKFFKNSTKDTSLLNVRKTIDWERVGQELIYHQFCAGTELITKGTLSIEEMIAKYRDRRDGTFKVLSPSPSPSPEPETVPPHANAESSMMDAESDVEDDVHIKIEKEESDVLGQLPSVLQRDISAPARRHSRTGSIVSNASQNISRPEPLLPIHNKEQEAKLAALGVTGTAKLVYQTPGPALGAAPEPETRNGHISTGGSNLPTQPVRQESNTVHQANRDGAHPRMTSSAPSPDPRDVSYDQSRAPPPPPGRPPNNQYRDRRDNGHLPSTANSRRTSSSSQHTAVGSDFSQEDRAESAQPHRKRKYSDEPESQQRRWTRWDRTPPEVRGDDRTGGDRRRQQSDDVGRRSKQPRVDDAYRRRW